MKRLVLILFLSFSTVTFFANEKSEALPDLTLNDYIDFKDYVEARMKIGFYR